MGGHRSHHNGYLSGRRRWCSSFEILALGDSYIELVQVVEFTVKAELLAAEGAMIRGHPCVNQIQAGRTRALYKIDNVDKIRADQVEYDAAYQAANAAKLHEKHICGCGGKFTTHNKAGHSKSIKHQAWAATQ